MNRWSESAKATYRRWKNTGKRSKSAFVGRADESQETDNEIYTVAAARAGSGGVEASLSGGSNKTEETFTVDDALEAFGFGRFQFKMCLLTGLSLAADAMELMLLSVLGPQLHCEWRLHSYQVALITSVVFIGMGIGSPFWGYISDNYGRRVGLVMSMCWIFYFSLLTAFSPVYSWLLILRGIVGFGLGGIHQSMTLLSEFLPVKWRGTCVLLAGLFWAGGAALEVLLALLTMPTLGWRWLVALSTIPIAIFLCLCFWMPESPRFDVVMTRREKAIATLMSIAKDNKKTLPQGKLVVHEQCSHGRFRDLFTPQYRKTTLLLWLIGFTDVFCYYGIILMTTELFKAEDLCRASLGADTEWCCSLECKYLASADYENLLWTTLAELPGILCISVFTDYMGRKKTLALCFFMFSLCILPLFACIGRTAVTIFVFIARAFITAGFQTVFVYASEVYPTEVRSLAMGTWNAMGRVGGFVTPFIAQVLLRTSLHLTLAVYCGCSLLAAFACLFLPTETAGKRLQETNLN
ncbi:synaptic vesicle 2-related protein-like [Salarias fasciatus]|uniref:synaptic vesicle 2-related protein-like n=1 Tax=Salarias fasciatus TaxID=181472 RepID=UPI001176EE34|nr:synaptic vesicle 2-related protein-like [Salarias fasciatus]